MRFLFITVAIWLTALPAQARPVSYPDGWMLMIMNDVESNAAQLNYSLTNKLALGYQHEYFRDSETHMDAFTIDNLLKRWNMPDGQANIFLKSGIGVSYGEDDTSPAAYTGLEFDWENRRLLTLYENRFIYAGKDEKSVSHMARVGIAPYIGDYGDTHTWLMLQADYDAGKSDKFSVTPLVRIFKGTTLVEAGYNLDGGALFNLTQQF